MFRIKGKIFMKFKQYASSLVLAGLVAGGLTACGGGSSDAPAGTEISGTATAPGGAVAMFEDHGVFYALGNFLVPSAGAAISGLQPVTGATVELIYVDNNGAQVGDVLASTTTSITGDYRLSLPAGVDFAANLVVRITGVNGTTLDAQVVEQTVDIDPISDFVLDKLVENGTALDTLAVNEVVWLTGQAEAFDLTAGADMTEMLAALDAEVGQFMDDNIVSINAGTGDGALAAGEYHLAEIDLELHDHEDPQISAGTFSGSIDQASVSIVDAGSGQLTATFTASVDEWFNLGLNGTATNNLLFVNTDLPSGSETLQGSIDGNGAVSFEWDFEEELDTVYEFGWRYPPGSIRMSGAPGSSVYLGQHNDAGVRYHLIDTDGDLQVDALDPSLKAGDEVGFSLVVMAKKSQGMDDSSLNGLYGMVGLDVQVVNGSGDIDVGAFYSIESFDGARGITENLLNAVDLSRSPNGAPTSSTDTVPANSSYVFGPDGDGSFAVHDIGDAVNFDRAFAGDNGNFFVVAAGGHTESSPSVIVSADQGMAMGVKLPAIAPNMTDRSYRMHSMSVTFAGSSTRIDNLGGGVISFNGDGSLNITGDSVRGVERTNDTAQVVPVSEPFDWGVSNQSVQIGDNGSVNIANITTGTDNMKFDGFVSADGKMLVLRSVYTGTATEKGVGMWVGVAQ